MIRTRWRRTTAQAVAALRAAALAEGGAALDPGSLDGEPAPVQRYLRWALPAGVPLPRTVTLQQDGTFNQGKGWSSFTATEHLAARPPGFVWAASIQLMPIVPALVRDSYLGGEGRMQAAMGGIVSIVNQGGTAAMARASLLRWLAEAAWLPVALLPRRGLRWEALDARAARVHLEDGDVAVALDVRFGADGGIAEVNGQRHRDVRGTAVLTPWRGRFSDHARRDGLMIPLTGEVSWVIEGKEAPYWRGRILAAQFA